MGTPVGELAEVIRAKKPIRLPVVMSRAEVRTVLSKPDGDKWLAAALMYGTGMRLMECLNFRVQDIDFEQSQILVSNGKGAKDRVTMLPETLKGKLWEHLARVKTIHEADLSEGWGGCADARCRGPQIYQGSDRVAVAVRPPAGTPLEKPRDRPTRPLPLPDLRRPIGGAIILTSP